MDTFNVGDTIDGKYEITRILGKGGMGLVVEARRPGLATPVALKVLLPKARDKPEVVARQASVGVERSLRALANGRSSGRAMMRSRNSWRSASLGPRAGSSAAAFAAARSHMLVDHVPGLFDSPAVAMSPATHPCWSFVAVSEVEVVVKQLSMVWPGFNW